MLRASELEDALNTSGEMAEATRMLVHNATETGEDKKCRFIWNNSI